MHSLPYVIQVCSMCKVKCSADRYLHQIFRDSGYCPLYWSFNIIYWFEMHYIHNILHTHTHIRSNLAWLFQKHV